MIPKGERFKNVHGVEGIISNYKNSNNVEVLVLGELHTVKSCNLFSGQFCENIKQDKNMSVKSTTIIKTSEGCELTAYKCPADVWTIGYGHTGDDVYEGLVISKEIAESLLESDLDTFSDNVNRLVVVELTQNQFDALVSLCYNIGAGNFGNSTLLKLLNQHDYDGASKEFNKWRKAGGKILKGLVRRREKETKLFLKK